MESDSKVFIDFNNDKKFIHSLRRYLNRMGALENIMANVHQDDSKKEKLQEGDRLDVLTEIGVRQKAN